MADKRVVLMANEKAVKMVAWLELCLVELMDHCKVASMVETMDRSMADS